MGHTLPPPVLKGVDTVRFLALALAMMALAVNSHSILQTPIQIEQPGSETQTRILNFDDIDTAPGGGWAKVPSSGPSQYHSLHFEGFYIFNPTDPEVERVISEADLNCATSKPNALYGTRFNFEDRPQRPFITRGSSGSSKDNQDDESNLLFELESLRVKPLDMPFSFTTFSLRGHQLIINNSNDSASADSSTSTLELEWNVDFPAGFHDMFDVKIEIFSGLKWDNLTRLEIWADFHQPGGIVLDWEYCLDDLQVRF